MSETTPLSVAQRKDLKAQAHHLNPVVAIGDAGLTPAVVKEALVALRAHELIKIRVHGDDREARAEMMQALCEQTGSHPVQMIGKLLVLYRPRTDEEEAAKRARDSASAPKKNTGKARTAKLTPANNHASRQNKAKSLRAGQPMPGKVKGGRVGGKLAERLSQRAMVGTAGPSSTKTKIR